MLNRCAGRVKWFNNKGFGFITAIGGSPRDGEDVFVHHSALCVNGDIYKYLVQGEYVSFNWTETTSGNHKWHATDVRGINNWQLMCESQAEGLVRSAEDGEQLPRQYRTGQQHTGQQRTGQQRTGQQRTGQQHRCDD